MIWNLTNRDKQTKKEIYHLLQQVGESLSKDFIEFIMDRIKEYPHLSRKDLEFLYSFKNKSELQSECTWKILNDATNYTEDVVKTAFEKLVDNIKFSTMQKKLVLMNDCVEKIKLHDSSLIFLKILKATVNCTNLSTAKVQNLQEEYEKVEHECLQYFYKDFNHYCEIVKIAVENDQSKYYSAASEVFLDQFTHQENIKERLLFIVEFYKFYKIKLSSEHLNLLWRLMAVEAPCKINCELFFKWMNDQVNSLDTKQYCVLNEEILENFYSEYLISPNNKYANLESEGFNLIKTLFKLVNEKAHKIQILNSAQAKKEHGTISSACGSTLTSTTYSSAANAKEFVVYVHPDELQGIEILWKIVTECTDLDVIAHCIMFIDAIFHNISDIIEHRRMEIEEDLVKKCISKIDELRKIVDAPLPDPEDEHMYKMVSYRKDYAMRQIERFFLHIRSFMENSESHGIDNFLLLGTLFDNTKIMIVINNKISWGQGCYNNKANPKKFQLLISQQATLWSVKQYISNKLGVDPVLLKIERLGFQSKEYKDSENSKTLKEIGITHNDKFSISTKMISTLLDHMNLLFSDKTLTPEADRLFTEVFSSFTNEEGYMTRKTCTEFLRFCTNQMTEENDVRIARLFDGYDHDKDNLITCENFKEFYKDSIIKKESTVWSNIRSWNYKTDLKQGNHRPSRDPETLLRYLIPKKKEYFNYFIDLLNYNNQISQYSWELLSRFTIDPDFYEKISKLEDVDEEGNKKPLNLKDLVDTNNPFQLQYLFVLLNQFLYHNSNVQNKAWIIYNEADFEAEQEDKDLAVKGEKVSTGVSCQTNTDIPAPTPAVPVSHAPKPQKSVQFEGSKSGEGKATHIVSAGSHGDVPMPPPPPLPVGIASPESLQHNNEVKFTKPKDEIKVYPPGGQMVDSDNEATPKKGKEDDKVYKNYEEIIFLPNEQAMIKNELSAGEWVLRFIEIGGFQFIFDLLMDENSFVNKKIMKLDMAMDIEKDCIITVVGMLNLLISGAFIANESKLLPSVDPQPEQTLQKVDEDKEMEDEEDPYELDEAKLLSRTKDQTPMRERTVSTIAREEDQATMIHFKNSILAFINNSNDSIIQVLKGHHGEQIINSVPYSNLMHHLLSSISTILNKRNINDKIRGVIKHCWYTLIPLLIFNEDLLKGFYEFQDPHTKTSMKELIVKGITFSSDLEIKGTVMHFVTVISKIIKHTKTARLPLFVILEAMKEHFFESIKDAARFYGYKEFYDTFCTLIHSYNIVKKENNKKFENIIEAKSFLKQLINILKDYKTKEKRNTVLEDHCLIGIFGTIERMLLDNPEYIEEAAINLGLLHEIFFSCLFQEALDAPHIDVTPSFDQNSTDLHTNKCKTKESRAKAFAILNLLVSNSSKVREMVYRDCLLKMVNCIERPEAFAHVAENDSRSFYSYSGLKNQGATCYMNSMVQQLYMIPAFKYLLLSIDDGKDEDLGTVDNEKSIYHNKMFDDNLLHQFQYTMGFLELTERPYYQTLGLCFSMKDWEGNPTNCSLQQDSHEFVNICFDRLEHMLKPTPQKYLFSDTFSAKQCTHMTCSNCKHVKSRVEDYYILSVPVKNLNNLEESFVAFTDGEVISDFKCDNCEQKVEINKRCSFVDMPNILMIHLQKIYFNLDTMMMEKIADRYEFPTYLNMENYTINKISEKYGINDPELENYKDNENKNFEYRLVGVIIHTGVAQAGHYYSLICTDPKIRDNKETEWVTTENLKWTEFNDTTIKDFNFRQNFEDECYGKNSSDVYGPRASSYESGWEQAAGGGSSKSAYVLIYEKREYNDIKLQVDINTVKQHGKNKEQREEEIKEARRKYLSSIYASYDRKPAVSDEPNEAMETSTEIDSQALLSSLECGDIALPRDLFPYLVIPHNISVFMSQDQRDSLRYIPVHYDREKDE